MNDIQYQYINPAPLLEALGGDHGACLHMFATFASSAPATYARLREAIDADDAEAVKREAHSLKSSTALVGAEALTALLKDIEQHAKQEPPQSVQGSLPVLVQMFEGALVEVQGFMEQ